ncbi:MAG: hypothetical protein QOJ52_962 [Acidimicrobiaceae bacterium]|jgi:hypothetical protein|nr:hypothetical protein [Acidimicrobiaceae bacterium]
MPLDHDGYRFRRQRPEQTAVAIYPSQERLPAFDLLEWCVLGFRVP